MTGNDLNRLAESSAGGLARLSGRQTGPVADPVQDGGDDLHIEYRPEDDGDPDPGEVVWAWIPFEEDPAQGKDRPVIVIGHVGERLAAVALSTKEHAERHDRVSIGSGAWDTEGRQSWAKLERIYGLADRQVRREGCRLEREAFDRVVDGLRNQRNWPDVDLDIVLPRRPGGAP